jgi:hypothetical protein
MSEDDHLFTRFIWARRLKYAVVWPPAQLTRGRDPGIFLAFFLRRRFELSSLIYEETVPIRPEDHVELSLH